MYGGPVAQYHRYNETDDTESESLENDKWSIGSKDDAFSVNLDGNESVKILTFKLSHKLLPKKCHSLFLTIANISLDNF